MFESSGTDLDAVAPRMLLEHGHQFRAQAQFARPIVHRHPAQLKHGFVGVRAVRILTQRLRADDTNDFPVRRRGWAVVHRAEKVGAGIEINLFHGAAQVSRVRFLFFGWRPIVRATCHAHSVHTYYM